MRYREPEHFSALRAEYVAWEASLPPIPEDARFDLAFTRAEIAHPW
jgi:hypothetical protein